MCGIAGIIDTTLNGEQRLEQLQRMVSLLKSRGPDADGVFDSGIVSLGHTRLKILDLSDRAAQPMCGFDDSLVLVFNGEIYNFPELASELYTKGYELSGHSDTEVILHGYHHWGVEVFTRLNGMFAIALLDTRSQELFLARDRVGKKPLFIQQDRNRVVFASTLQAIRSVTPEARLSASGIREYMTTGYVSFSESIFSGIEQILPGQLMRIDLSGDQIGSIESSQYWEFPFEKAATKSYEDWESSLSKLLNESVRTRLLSDRPLGLFLSGGLDSALISSLVRNHKKDNIHAFCCSFSESEYSELSLAEKTAEELALNLHSVQCPPPTEQAVREMVAGMGSPLGDSSYFPMHWLCKAAKEKVAVVLSGDGADELFAGYDTYYASQISQNILVNNPLSRAVFAIASRLLRVSEKKMGFEYRLEAFRRALHYPFPARHYMWRAMLDEKRRRGVLSSRCLRESDALTSKQSFTSLLRRLGQLSNFAAARAVDFHTWLSGDILQKVDLSSMAHGLEVRSPFLDYRLVEAATRLPDEYVREGRVGKRILRSLAQEILPSRVRQVPKQGFNAPVPGWFRGELGEFAREVFLMAEERSEGLIQTAPLQRILEDHQGRKIDAGYFLWAVLVLLLWLEQHSRVAD